MTSRESISLRKKHLIAHRQEWKCNQCGSHLPPEFDIDHVRALCDGGANSMDNLQALCKACHGTKTHMDMIRLEDRRREERTGRSKYFEPYSIYYTPHGAPKSEAAKRYFEKFKRKSK